MRKGILKITLLITMFPFLGCGTSAPNNNTGTYSSPANYPRPVIEPAAGCELICMQYRAGGDLFCDSDCDGWYDAVEVEFGYNPCNSYSPSHAPDSYALVCSEVKSYLRVSSEPNEEIQASSVENQRMELSNQ